MEISKLTNEQIIELALIEKEDSDERWKYVQALHTRGTQEVFDLMKKLCESEDSNKTALGADVLGQLGTVDLPFRKETIPLLLNRIDSKLGTSDKYEDISALRSVIFALGRMDDDDCRKKILEFKNHKSEDIRYAVVHGISGIENDEEIKSLIQLSSDSDKNVRNWATFGLGSQIKTNTPEIRDALFQRLGEEVGNEVGDEIRGEALLGLAIRKDKRVIKPLIKELSLESVGTLAVEAAVEAADFELCDALLELASRWDSDIDLMKKAIENCCPNQESD